MKRLILICIILIALPSCLVKETRVVELDPLLPNIKHDLNQHDPTFDPYLRQLEHILKRPLVTTVRFLNSEEMEGAEKSYNAICYFDRNVIVFNKTEWDRASDEWRLAILLHEVGHCVFDLLHSSEEPDCDGNIMHYKGSCTFNAFNDKTVEQIREEIK